MKSQSPSSRGYSKQEEQVDNDMMTTIAVHVNESAKVIFNIKQCLYELVKLNVMANPPIKKYQTNPAVLAGSKKNLDDLRRIQSMLKGYLHTIKIQSSQNSEEDIRNSLNKNNTQSSLLLTNPSLGKEFVSSSATSSNINSPKNMITGLTISQKMLQNANYHKQVEAMNSQLESLRQQNKRLKNEMEASKQRDQFKIFESREDKLRASKSNPKLPIKESNILKMKQQKMSTVSQSKLSPELKLNLHSQQEVDLKQQNKEQSSNKKKLQGCKSAVFETSRNLIEIRNRNKQCLQLIRSIKKEIGLQQKEQAKQ